MSDTLKMTMVTSVDGAEPLPMPLEESMRWTKPVPVSAIKESRGDRSQREIARAAGLSQAFVSELESGRKRLTPGTAQKLAPVLGTTPDQLMRAECEVNLERVARMVRVDPQLLLAEAERLAEIVPGREIGDAIIDALVKIARDRQKALN